MTNVIFRFIDSTTNVIVADTPCLSTNIKWKLSQSAEWSASFPKNVAAVQEIQNGSIVQIYMNSRLIMEGYLQSIGEKWDNGQLVYDLQGRSALDKLYDTRAYSQAFFNTKPILLILGELLRKAGWRLGDISTLLNPTDTFTVDLRAEKRILPQIGTFIDGLPQTFFRYGGEILDVFALDVGTFNEPSGVSFYVPPDGEITQSDENTGWIENLSFKTTLTDIVNSVEVIGGDVKDNTGVTRAITLKDALTADPTLATDPDFPIITEIANFVYYIRNNAVPLTTGSQSTERYTQYAPEKESGNATLAACNSAGLALYNRGVTFLLDAQENKTTITFSAIGDELYHEVGDTVYIKAQHKLPIYDPFADELTEFITSEIDGDFRVTSLGLSFSDGKANWDIEATDSPVVSQSDLFVSLYDTTKRDSPPSGAVYAPPFAPVLATISTTQTGGIPDTTLSDGTPAISVQLALPVAPGSSSGVYLAGIPVVTSAFGTPIVELVSDPVYPTTGPIIKIALKNLGWTGAYSASITAYIVWI